MRASARMLIRPAGSFANWPSVSSGNASYSHLVVAAVIIVSPSIASRSLLASPVS